MAGVTCVASGAAQCPLSYADLFGTGEPIPQRISISDPATRAVRPFSFSLPTYDVLGDGSIIALQLPGHTPGSVGYLVSDWLFVGDALWRREGQKSRLASAVDEDAAEAAHTRESLRTLVRERPRLRIIPAHDAQALEELPACE